MPSNCTSEPQKVGKEEGQEEEEKEEEEEEEEGRRRRKGRRREATACTLQPYPPCFSRYSVCIQYNTEVEERQKWVRSGIPIT